MGSGIGRERKARALSAIACLVAFFAIAGGCGGTDATTTVKTVTAPGESTAVLHELNGSGASGTAVYTENSYHVPIKIELKGLEPAAGENQYVIWEVTSDGGTRELGTYHVPASGRLSVEIASVFLYSLGEASKTELLITKVKSDDYLREKVSESPEAEHPTYLGAPIARGGPEAP
jgi:hypothetical protein